MKNYTRKALHRLAVVSVYNTFKGRREVMRFIREPYVVSGIPSGFFSLEDNVILLPKRRRGEKFVVHYTVMHKIVL